MNTNISFKKKKLTKMSSISISHQHHPARRQGKSLVGLAVIKYALATNKSLMIGCTDVNAMYLKVKSLYPEAKLSKGKDCVIVEKM